MKEVIYLIQEKDKKGNKKFVEHSRLPEGYLIEFKNRSRAIAILEAKKRANPNHSYRLITKIINYKFSDWK